jgi:hypothetical protein
VLSALFHAPERPHPAEPGRTTSFDFVEPFERLLIDGNVDRSLHSAEPRTDAELLVNAVTWTYLHMRRSHRWAQHTAADRTITMATSALRASAPAPASDTRPS